MEGHRDIQRRTTDKNQNWLRDVFLAVEKSQRLDHWLRPNRLVDMLNNRGVEVPGLMDGDDLGDSSTRDKAFRALGIRLAACLGDDDVLELDSFRIMRRVENDDRGRPQKEFCFQRLFSLKSPASDPKEDPEAKHHIPQRPEGTPNNFQEDEDKKSICQRTGNLFGDFGSLRADGYDVMPLPPAYSAAEDDHAF